MNIPFYVRLAAAVPAILISSCGGGGDHHVQSLQQPTLVVVAQPIKSLAFTWGELAGATRIDLLQDVDGAAGAAAEHTLATLPATARAYTLHDVFLPELVNATFRLRACNAFECVESSQVSPGSLNAGIGYFKSSNRQYSADQFGKGLALSGDGSVMAVGAPYENRNSAGINPPATTSTMANLGAVYVFQRSASGWQQSAYIKPQVPLANASFGFSVALSSDGNVMVVGSSTHDEVAPHSGAMFVFRRQASGDWVQEALLKAPLPQSQARLGSVVALSADGEWAAASQPYAAGGGEVLVFRYLGGVWAFAKTLTGSNTEAGDEFGDAMALSGDGSLILVGARHEDGAAAGGSDNSLQSAGAAYVFKRNPSGDWPELAYLKAAQPRAGAQFGDEVASTLQGDILAVSGPLAAPVTGDASEVQLYRRDAVAGWLAADRLSPAIDNAGDQYGRGSLVLSADGSLLAVAATFEPGDASGLDGYVAAGTTVDAGAVHVFRRDSAGAWSPPHYIKAPNNQTNLRFGFAMAIAADGRTLAVHARDASASTGIGGDPTDRSAPLAGAVYLY